MKNASSIVTALFAVLFVGCAAVVNSSTSANPDIGATSQTSTQFSGADKVIYHFGDSSIPPEWHRSYTITITGKTAELVVDSYGKIVDTAKIDIDNEKFEALIKTIRKAEIHKVDVKSPSPFCSGGTSESLKIYQQKTELFSGDVSHCQGDWGTLAGDLRSVKAELVDLFPDKKAKLK